MPNWFCFRPNPKSSGSGLKKKENQSRVALLHLSLSLCGAFLLSPKLPSIHLLKTPILLPLLSLLTSCLLLLSLPRVCFNLESHRDFNRPNCLASHQKPNPNFYTRHLLNPNSWSFCTLSEIEKGSVLKLGFLTVEAFFPI